MTYQILNDYITYQILNDYITYQILNNYITYQILNDYITYQIKIINFQKENDPAFLMRRAFKRMVSIGNIDLSVPLNTTWYYVYTVSPLITKLKNKLERIVQ